MATTAVMAATTMVTATVASAGPPSRGDSTWTQVTEAAPWAARAGLQAASFRGRLWIFGGRVPNPPRTPPVPGDSRLLNDVWSSGDGGRTWREEVPDGSPGMWAPRAYFASVVAGGYLYVLGGQDYRVTPNVCPPGVPGCPPFVSSSRFFDDVWRSRDGVHWEQVTADAPWEGRAGLSAAVLGGEIYVFAGSRNDDSAIIGGPPQRIYYRDVWKSRDGRTWTPLGEAPWAARAGAATVVRGGTLYVLGGEAGFICTPLPGCVPPYFNDVWATRDGRRWEQVTPSAGWSPRPGHKCEVVSDRIVCFGGFGLLANPVDVWASKDGRDWTQLAEAPWNATSPDQIKYDFAVTVAAGRGGGLSIFTFGGDRETFDLNDPTNYLRVDRDVWRFELERPGSIG